MRAEVMRSMVVITIWTVWLARSLLTRPPRVLGRLLSPAPPDSLVVEARAGGRVWLEARVDGSAQYSGWMEAEQHLRLEAAREVYLWCGRADKLAVSVDGRSVGALAAITEAAPGSPGWVTFQLGHGDPLLGV